jgi:hypothetical protein
MDGTLSDFELSVTRCGSRRIVFAMSFGREGELRLRAFHVSIGVK